MVDAGLIESAREQLHRMLRSDAFRASQRNRDFLRFIVEEALSGRGERIKAYSIATQVFGREADFDPQKDAIVRIEAQRLRRAIDHYYLTKGRSDPVRISIPKGSYVPWFGEIARPVSASSIADRDRSAGPTVFVAPFESEVDEAYTIDFARGLTRQIVVGLTRFCDLYVYGPETSAEWADRDFLAEHLTELDVEYVVRGAVSVTQKQMRIEAMLLDTEHGRVLWAQTFDRDLTPEQIVETRDKVANSVARSLAQPYGAIFANKAIDADGRQTADLDAYDCVVRFYQYWHNYTPEAFSAAAKCLIRAVERDPDYAEALACLSQIYTDSLRFGFPLPDERDDPAGRALELARRAIELAPQSSRSFHALAVAYWFAGNVSASLEAYETGLSLNPNATEIMGELGFRRALRMDWETAVPLIRKSYERNPAQAGSFRIGLALWHFMEGRPEETLSEAQKVGATAVVYGFLCEAAALADLGRQKDAGEVIRRIHAIDPTYGPELEADLQKRQVHPEITARLKDALRRAGLQVDAPGPPTSA